MCDLKRKHKLFSIFILIIKCARDPQQICALARQFLMMANHFMCNAMRCNTIRCKAFQARCHYYQYRFIICNAIFVSISVVIKFNDFIDEFLHFGWGFCIKRAHRLDFFSSKNAIYWNRFPLRVRVKEMENALQIDAIWTRWEDVPKKSKYEFLQTLNGMQWKWSYSTYSLALDLNAVWKMPSILVIIHLKRKHSLYRRLSKQFWLQYG